MKIFKNKKFYLMGLVFFLAGLFLINASSALAAGCQEKTEGISFFSAFNPLISFAEETLKSFGYNVALATAPDPDTCGSDSAVCFDPTFIDSSASAHTMTAYSDAQIDATQSKFGGASGNFNVAGGGTGHLTTPGSSDFAFGTGDFTIDFWVNFSDSPAGGAMLVHIIGSANSYIWAYNSTLRVGLAGSTEYIFAWPPTLNTWHHIAVTRSGTSLRAFADGTQIGTTQTSSDNITSTGNLTIGRYGEESSYYLRGWLDEVRISKGTDRGWTGNTIPLPSAPYTTDSDTKLLLHMDGTPRSTPAATISWEAASASYYILTVSDYTKLLLHMDGTNGSTNFIDSGLGRLVTTYGNAKILTNESKFGSNSAYFGGSSGYLTSPDSDDWNVGNGAFTLDFWVRASNVTGFRALFNKRTDAGSYNYIVIAVYNNTVSFWATSNGTAWDIANAVSMGSISADIWTHFAMSRSGNNIYLFKNGILTNTIVSSAPFYINSAPIRIGGESTPGYEFTGWIDEFRFSKDIARWTSNFTPPTSAYTTDSYTKLLLHADGSGNLFVDSSGTGKTVTAYGDATQGMYKFGGASGNFDGDGDYLSIPDSDDWNFGSSDFTIDMWVSLSSLEDPISIGPYKGFTLISQTAPAATPYWRLWWYKAGQQLVFEGYAGAGASQYFGASGFWSPTVNTWYHVAVVKTGGAIKLFVNASQVGSDYPMPYAMPDIANSLLIGKFWYNPDTIPAYLNGYTDELRVSKGIARWTSNFTPPTEPYQEIPGVGTYNTGSNNSYTISGLANNTTYNWSVEAYNSSDQSSASLGYTGQPSGSFITPTCALPPCTLTVTKSGTGSGTVTSSPSGISCGSDCSEAYDCAAPPSVTLTAQPDSGYAFGGWSGDADCSDGIVTVDASKTCTATFNPIVPDFSLFTFPSGSIYATIVSNQPGQSTTVTVQVAPLSGFSSNVALSVESVSPNLPSGTTFSFDSSTVNLGQVGATLDQSHYSSGSQFKVNIGAGLTSSQIYTIVIKGADGGLTRTSTVYLNVQIKSPYWREI